MRLFVMAATFASTAAPTPRPTTSCTSVDFGEPSYNFGHIITTLADEVVCAFAIDLDGDGDVDVLSASKADNTVAWYENDGAQSFAARVITTLAESARSVIAAHRARKSAAVPAPATPRPPKGMSLAGIFGVPQSPEAASVQI